VIAAIGLLVFGQFIPGTKLVTEPEAPPERPFYWTTPDVLGRGADRTFVIKGTRAGGRYRFQATGVCKWEGIPMHFVGGPPHRMFRRTGHIFGIDFRIQFGSSPEKVILNVGTNRPEQTALDFVADRDDVAVRVFDNWDLPKGVTCSIDGIGVLSAPAE
jgi:hypothetical protein